MVNPSDAASPAPMRWARHGRLGLFLAGASLAKVINCLW